MKKLFVVSLMALGASLTGCNKEQSTPAGKEGKSTVLVSVGTSATGTRAEGELVQTDPTLSLKEGYILFTNSNKVIERYVKMKSTPTPSDPNEILLPTGSTPSATVDDVPNSAVQCHIFSNIPSSVNVPSIITEGATHLDTFLDEVMGVNVLYDNVAQDGGVATVPMWGTGNVVNTTDPMTTTVQVYAMGARLQVEKITGITDIVSYQLDGIFVNNFFDKMSVGYKLETTDLKNNKSDVDKYKVPGGAYDSYFLSDYNTTGIANFNSTTKEATPLSEDAWVYNIWPTEGLISPDATTIPRLIFVLSEVEYSVGGVTQPKVANPMYLTVKGMKDKSKVAPNDAVTVIKKGNSYTFSDIQFEFKNLTTVPETEAIDATVTIDLIDWVNTDVEPEL